MQKITVLALALALSLLPLSAAHALTGADFYLVNDTGHVITSVRFKAHGSRYWGNDVLGRGLLMPGESTTIEFYGSPSCNEDIQLVYLDGRKDEYLRGQNLCNTMSIRFMYGHSSTTPVRW